MTEEAPRRLEARRGFSLSYRGKTLLSLIDPAAQAEGIAAALPVKGRTLYFCPSPLYGYGLGTLLEKLGPGSAVLCVETDERLMEIASGALGPLLGRDPRLALVHAADPAALCAYTRKVWGSRTFRRVETVRLTGGWRLEPDTYGALEGALIRDIALTWGNAMTLVKLGRRYARNALRNLPLLASSPPLSGLAFGGKPLLVLGAGPSLDGVLPALLRRFGPGLEGRPFGIVCADTALPALQDRGIRPDLAAALESQQWNLRDFIGLGAWKKGEVPLAMDLSALPATARALGGEPRFFFTPWTELALFRRLEAAGLLPESLPPLGSVGLSAAALALRLSSGPLIASGLDFSFTLDSYHARSSPGHRDRLARQDRFLGILNAGAAFRPGAGGAVSKSGLPVRTDPALKNYRDLFEREFSGEGRFYDIAGPGLPLGLKTLSLAEALDVLGGGGEKAPVPSGGSGEAAGFGAGGALAGAAAVCEGGMEDRGPPPDDKKARLADFIREERESLARLRDMLSGAVQAEGLEGLLDRNDYLWAHFPDCAAREGQRPPATDLSFLKRVRVEIEPALRLFDRGLEELATGLAHINIPNRWDQTESGAGGGGRSAPRSP